jgi:hypothetical protein
MNMGSERERQIKQNTLRFLENLPNEKLAEMINSPAFIDDVFRYAGHSTALTQKIEEIFKTEYHNLPLSEQEEVDAAAKRLAEKFRSISARDSAQLTADQSSGHNLITAEIKSSARAFGPGDVVSFRGVSNVRDIKRFVIQLVDKLTEGVIEVNWAGEAPAVASGGSAQLPSSSPVNVSDWTFQLEGGRSDLKSKNTTLRIRLLKGSKFPVPRIKVFLVTATGEMIAAEEPPE